MSGIVTLNTLWCADKLILETILQDRNKKFRRRIVREINLSTHWSAGEGEIRDNTDSAGFSHDVDAVANAFIQYADSARKTI
ncbi:hypothetical protein, partial [Blautia sp.]|uniref:hypothetical protein n=1 Tax=Blautia sp. TaxID=1955243 RepID=UPI003A9580C1